MHLSPLLCVLLLIGPSLAVSQDVFYGGESSVPENWWTVGWGGVKTEVEPGVAAQGQAASLALLVSEDAEAWSGGGLRMSTDVPTPFVFDVDAWDNLELAFKVNGGVSPEGKRQGGQNIQVQLQFWTTANEVVSPDESLMEVRGSFVPINEFLEGDVVDDDTETWQQVSIPLNRFLPSSTDTVLGMAYIGFQFMDKAPEFGLYVTDIEIREVSE